MSTRIRLPKRTPPPAETHTDAQSQRDTPRGYNRPGALVAVYIHPDGTTLSKLCDGLTADDAGPLETVVGEHKYIRLVVIRPADAFSADAEGPVFISRRGVFSTRVIYAYAVNKHALDLANLREQAEAEAHLHAICGGDEGDITLPPRHISDVAVYVREDDDWLLDVKGRLVRAVTTEDNRTHYVHAPPGGVTPEA